MMPAQTPELHLVLSTRDGRTRFHLGEIIDLDLAYSSSSSESGKYLLLTMPSKIKGHAATLTIVPGEYVIDRYRDNGFRNIFPILHANCDGFSSGVGGGCGDCDAELPLSSSPVHFPYSLTAQFQITKAGSYLIRAESDDVILAPLSLTTSQPIPLTSNSLEIEVADDPVWSEEQLQKAITRFENARAEYVRNQWNLVSMDRMESSQIPARIGLQTEMRHAVEAMRVLDTETSLRKAVQLYNQVEPDDNFFTGILWEAIVQSKHRALAIQLLSARIVDPDFGVSTGLLDQLTAMELENQYPDAFSRDDRDYRVQIFPSARQILQEHVLAFGDSLAEKNAESFALSLETFKIYASEQFCTDEPLIPNATTRQILKSVQALDAGPAQ